MKRQKNDYLHATPAGRQNPDGQLQLPQPASKVPARRHALHRVLRPAALDPHHVTAEQLGAAMTGAGSDASDSSARIPTTSKTENTTGATAAGTSEDTVR